METTVNRVELKGYLGRDAEVKNLENGNSLISLRMATNESYKNAKGEWVTNTTWHSVSIWKKKIGEEVDLLKKGALVAVTGKLETRKYTDKLGQDRYITQVVAQGVEPVQAEK